MSAPSFSASMLATMIRLVLDALLKVGGNSSNFCNRLNNRSEFLDAFPVLDDAGEERPSRAS